MQEKVDQIIIHMSNSNQHMARILDAEREIAVRMAQIIHALPDHNPQLEGISALIENSGLINKNIISYLSTIADLEEAVAEHLTHVIKELRGHEEE